MKTNNIISRLSGAPSAIQVGSSSCLCVRQTASGRVPQLPRGICARYKESCPHVIYIYQYIIPNQHAALAHRSHDSTQQSRTMSNPVRELSCGGSRDLLA
jgi:hypothetical protein